jgi:hypothetical protein
MVRSTSLGGKMKDVLGLNRLQTFPTRTAQQYHLRELFWQKAHEQNFEEK